METPEKDQRPVFTPVLGYFFDAVLIGIGLVVLVGRFAGCLEVNIKHLDHAAEDRARGE